MKHITRLILFLLLCVSVQAKEYNWKYLHIIDADTLLFEALWSPLETKVISVRLYGIDAPETFRPKCKEEFAAGLKAKDYVKTTLDKAESITVKPLMWGKYGGTLLALVSVDGEDLSEKILKAGLAREYHGKRKAGWC